MTELQKLKRLVENAIKCFDGDLSQIANQILSEGDLERLLTNRIEECLSEEYVIHNQVSYYGDTNVLKYRVDCVVMHSNGIKDSILNHKGYRYDGVSIAIEWKYYRKTDSVASIENDIKKSNTIKNNPKAFLFIVALLEEENKMKGEKISNIANKYNNNNNFSVKILTKNKEL